MSAQDPPRRLRDVDLAERYGLTKWTAGELIRQMVAAGVVVRRGRFTFGWLAACDVWVAGDLAHATRKAGAK